MEKIMSTFLDTLKVFGLVIGFGFVWALMSDDDFHKKFDKPIEIRYNCDALIGGWHPDVPREVIRKCRELNERYINVKTYKE